MHTDDEHMFSDCTEHKEEADLARLGNMWKVTEYIHSTTAPYVPLFNTLYSFIFLFRSSSEANIVLFALLNLSDSFGRYFSG